MAVSKEGDDVSKFFIFDTRLGQREENEHEKILFYYPASATLDQKQSDVGLCVIDQCLTQLNFTPLKHVALVIMNMSPLAVARPSSTSREHSAPTSLVGRCTQTKCDRCSGNPSLVCGWCWLQSEPRFRIATQTATAKTI